ncbi:MAG: hypothetical protein GY873_03285 [Bosea sp.]|uniref:hypothetical protein n=1 Tax=Bosea sp. (in: a-proteobacteria) TaxID=1871050 RepID=UPI00239D36C5|nr:hypothetical protein [Bosea sp. (in: a-proteobacteria)]MCP4733194.1 hypothetical protein [Bosea sp. (in: a-proteobacteria)]
MKPKSIFQLALCVVCLCALTACQDDERQIEDIIVKYGFSRNVPPSKLYGPGSLVAKEKYDPRDVNPRSVQLTSLCTARYSVDLYNFKPAFSDTESRDISSQFGGSFSIGAPALKTIFNLSATARAAKSAVVTVADAKIYTYGRDELSEIRSILRPVCREAVLANIATDNAHQVLKVLEATIELKISFDVAANASVKAKAVTELLDAGFTVDPSSDSITTKGSALYYGVSLVPVSKI